MGFRLYVLMLAVSPLIAPLHAQNTVDKKAAENVFLDSTAKQRLILRGFSAEPVVEYQWTANRLVMQDPTVRTFAVIEVVSLSTKADRIEIVTRRRTLLRSNSGSFVASVDTPVKLHIELGGADPATVLPLLKSQLFFHDLDEALVAIPAPYKSLLPFQDKELSSPSKPGKIVLSDDERGKLDIKSCPTAPDSFTPPKIVFRPEPEITQQAARMGFIGDFAVVITFLPSGQIADPWLAKPAGYGLDEAAINSITKFRFEPATCNGSPIPFSTAVITHRDRQ